MAERKPLLLTLLALALFMLLLSHGSTAQNPVPSKYDGFLYPGARVSGDSIMVEAFFDPMCPDSRDSWPPLKQALQYYSPRVFLIVHPFALPYHSSSYVSCRSLHTVNKLNASGTYPLLELFFKNQEKYYNAPTYYVSRATVISEMAKLAVMAIGDNSVSAFLSGFNKSETDTAARTSFKYGCSRGVFGTPTFLVNGFLLPDMGSSLDYKKWRSIIDPLLVKKKTMERTSEVSG